MTKKQIQIQDLLSTADESYYSGSYAQSIELYKKILALDPENERAKHQITKADLLIIENDKTTPLPPEATMAFRRARSLINAHALEPAIILLRESIEIAQKSGVSFSQAENLLSSLYDSLKELKIPKAFISYSRSDFHTASDIYWFLRKNECNPWMDIYNLIPGQDWESEIRHNIKSSDYFIACLSKNSVSKRGYVQKELKEAISVLEQIPEGEIYIIPIRLDDCVVPDSLSSKHWLDWSLPIAKETLLKAIKSKR